MSMSRMMLKGISRDLRNKSSTIKRMHEGKSKHTNLPMTKS